MSLKSVDQNIEIENLTNASVLIHAEGEKILMDPWFTDGIYMGTWHNFPRVNFEVLKKKLANVSYCLITHLHKDHFDINAINKFLNKETIFLVPKVFGWQVIKGVLNRSGFENINILDCSIDKFETERFIIQAVPPLNVSGLEEATNNELSIDGGFVLINKTSRAKIVFLADNNLYSEERIKENLKLIGNPDVIGFAYSGFASDYPYNYNFSLKEKIKICNNSEAKRFEIQVNHLKLIKPKHVIPYSSEFIPVGKHAKNWHEVYPHIWTSSKQTVAKKYAEALSINASALYPDDKLIIDGSRNIKVHIDNQADNLNKQMRHYYQSNSREDSFMLSHSDSKISQEEISELLKFASSNYALALKKHGLRPKQELVFRDGDTCLGTIDTNGGFQYLQNNIDNDKPFFVLYVDLFLLERLLKGYEHWNDAVLSLRLNYDRIPNMFCIDTLNALNYLKA
jgi:L-ascorbate metabolism protein UlaG (beta-lactamase superfamily)